MLIIRNYFLSIPRSLGESAEIDGANDITILFRIILPTSTPVLATIGLFYAVDRWNEWFHGILFMRDIAKQPLQLALRQITTQVVNLGVPQVEGQVFFENGVKTASIFVVMTPIMLLYPFVQRYFMRGIMIGALKG
jgi:putative aldouronate transport system permease protein